MVDYELGTSQRFKIDWKDVDTEEYTDPDTMGTFKIYDEDLKVIVTEASPSKSATGKYYVDVALTAANEFEVGTFMYEWTCTMASVFPIVVRGLFGIKVTRPTPL